MQCQSIKPNDISQLVTTYEFNADAVVSEYADFCKAFCSLQTNPGVAAAQESAEDDEQNNSMSNDNSDIIDMDEPVEERLEQEGDLAAKRKALNSFTAPFQILNQLSGYPHLLTVYWTL